MSAPEFSRIVKVRPHPPQTLTVEAGPEERAALAARCGVRSIESLGADLAFADDGSVIDATGRLAVDLTQTCAVSGDEIAVRIDEPLHLRFVTALRAVSPDEEIELAADEPDEIEFDGESFDIGEAVAQTLVLAIDPYLVGPDADAVREEAGIADESTPRGAFAEALSKLSIR